MVTEIDSFKIIGIKIRTTNENNKAVSDLSNLWGKFFSENLIAKIPQKISSEIYCIYTEYESDYTKPYTAIIGCKVENLDVIPEGMVGKTIEKGSYKKFITNGSLSKGIVFKKWSEIWNSKLKRRYSADFEVYGEKAQNPEDAEVEIYVSVKE